MRKRLLDNEQKYLLVTKGAEFGEKFCQKEGGNMFAIVTAALLTEHDHPLALLTALAAEKTLFKEVNAFLSRQPAMNDEDATQSATIFHDACLLGYMA